MKNKKVVFLLSFGHCGIDWMHSLLNGHNNLLIMPLFSYYRTHKIINADKAVTQDEVFRIWKNHFDNDDFQEELDGKFFYTSIEKDSFYNKFRELLEVNGHNRKQAFLAIHEAYAFCKNINLDTVKTTVVHEHVCFPFENIYEDFKDDLNVLMIKRDPRAAIAGYFKGMNRKFSTRPDYYDYYFNMSLEEWLNACEIWNKYNSILGEKIYLIRNENLSQNLIEEMKKLANWLGVPYENSLEYCKYPDGSPWKIDSCYVSKKEKAEADNSFFSPENVEKRWRNVLSDKREILMIEYLYEDFMKEFNYKLDNNLNIFNRVKAWIYFVRPHRGVLRLNTYPVGKEELDRFEARLALKGQIVRKKLFNVLPKCLKKRVLILSSIYLRIAMLHFPGNRWKRYDKLGLY